MSKELKQYTEKAREIAKTAAVTRWSVADMIEFYEQHEKIHPAVKQLAEREYEVYMTQSEEDVQEEKA